MKKSLIIILIILIITLTSAFYIISNKEDSNAINTKQNLNFTVGECNSEIDPYTNPMFGIISKEWLNENTLLIKAYLKTYCGGVEIRGDFKIKGDKLILEYDFITGEYLTQCNCAHELNYEISNLEKKDYSISFNSGQIYPSEEDTNNCIGFEKEFKYEKECCNGLKPIEVCGLEYNPDSSEADEKGCIQYRCTHEICYPCGDGSCEYQENPCNCPEDCKVV